jgi:excinuclease ABC subunit C
MNTRQLKKIKLPKTPGVYFFLGSPKRSEGGKKGNNILYIGKATSLRDRVKSYFGKDPKGKITSYGAGLIATRGPLIVQMVEETTSIKWQSTDSVLEALILEANLIKKYQPKYNTKEKDNKSFNYVGVTKPARAGGEEIPKVLVIRGRNLRHLAEKNYSKNLSFSSVFGPFPNGVQLKDAMTIVRRIFPYMDNDSMKRNNREFYKQVGLIPTGEYKENIKNIKLLFQGKKKSIVINLKREMMAFAKKREFEKAGETKRKIFALEHINDVALIKDENISPWHISGSNRLPLARPTGSAYAHTYDFHQTYAKAQFRIESYDIAHMGGSNMVGVMTVIENEILAKSEYKKFIVRTQDKSNDTGALEEVLSRRLRHIEWGLPNLIVVDGSTAQINVAKSVLSRYQFKIPVVSVVKDEHHKAKAIMGDESLIKQYKKQILLINSEAHRFAIAFHKKRRNKNFLSN